MEEWKDYDSHPINGEYFTVWNGKEMAILNQPNNCVLGKWKKIDGEWMVTMAIYTLDKIAIVTKRDNQ